MTNIPSEVVNVFRNEFLNVLGTNTNFANLQIIRKSDLFKIFNSAKQDLKVNNNMNLQLSIKNKQIEDFNNNPRMKSRRKSTRRSKRNKNHQNVNTPVIANKPRPEFLTEHNLNQLSKICQHIKTNHTPKKTIKPLPKIKLSPVPGFIEQIIENEAETKFWSKSYDKVNVIEVFEGTQEYDMVSYQFTECDKNFDYYITKLERIENPFLLAGFVMKRLEYESLEPKMMVHTNILFHATSYVGTKDIINENFDWRLAGRKRGHKYGYGTCFSPMSEFASQFGTAKKCDHFMLLCYVLQRKSIPGDENNLHMVVPPEGVDTTVNNHGKVVVKFDDDTAYPAYRITYQKRDMRANNYKIMHKNFSSQTQDYYDNYQDFNDSVVNRPKKSRKRSRKKKKKNLKDNRYAPY